MLAEAYKSFQRADVAAGAKLLERAVEAAVTESNRAVEAQARQGLAEYLNRTGQYELSGKQLLAALVLYEQLGDLSNAASVKTALGQNAYQGGQPDESARYYREAMSFYSSTNDRAAIAMLHNSLS